MEKATRGYFIKFDYSTLKLQLCDTIEYYCSENHLVNEHSNINKGFFLGFDNAVYEMGKGVKGFRNLLIFNNHKNDIYVIRCNCEVPFTFKHTIVKSTRMVLTEKANFNKHYMLNKGL